MYAPWLPTSSTTGESFVYLSNPFTTPILRTRLGRVAWSLLAHPVKSREFPAHRERLITRAELMQYGF
jgi:hypothetical protein